MAAAMVVVCGAGGWLLTVVYRQAAAGGRPFALLWAALSLLFLPPAVALAGRSVSPRLRLFALGVLSVVSALPKVLRSPRRPVFSDEFAHLREVANLTEGWDLFVSNALVRMASEFPSMHAAAAAVADGLGVPAWVASQSLVAVAHALLLWAVFALVSRFASLRSAGLATLVYAANPSFLLFSMQVSYESFALPLAFWALAAAVVWAAGGAGRRPVVLAVSVSAALLVGFSHHLSSAGLAGALLAVSVGSLWYGARRQAYALAGLASATAATFGLWVWLRRVELGSYLSPSLQLSSPSRRPFGGSQLPGVEQLAGLLLPGAVTALVVWSVLQLRRSWRGLPGPAVGLSLLTLGLFASFPLVLLASTAEGARRSWAWTYLGLAMLVALASDAPLGGRAPGRRSRVVVAAMVALLAFGGQAVSQNERYRLPGPLEAGVDARGVTDEAWRLAQVLAPQIEPGERLLADRYVRGPIAVTSPVRAVSPSQSFPAWDALFVSDPSQAAVDTLASGVDLVVVDLRMADVAPAQGFWFNRDEPPGSRLAEGAIELLDCVGVRIAQSGSYVVWRLSSSSAPDGVGVDAGCVWEGP